MALKTKISSENILMIKNYSGKPMKKIISALLPSAIVHIIGRHLALEKARKINSKYKGRKAIVSLGDVTPSVYDELRNYREAEHQCGRYLNMKKVVSEMEKLKVEGDIVEFGTWQGHGLVLLDMAFGIKTDRAMIGVDSFEGLPESSTIWNKHAFDNTSLEKVEEYLSDSIHNCVGYSLIKGWFSDPDVKLSLHSRTKRVALVHFDADLGSSTTAALSLIENYLFDRKEPLFLLFDDWGCHPDEVPDAYYAWEKFASKEFNFASEKVCSTNLTRYLKLSFQSNG